MKVYDMHCDTISRIEELRKQGKQAELRRNRLHLDLEKMKQGDYSLQTFALFLDQAETENCFEKGKELCRVFKEELAKNQDMISQVLSWKEIEENEKAGRLSALLSLEEGAMFEEAPKQLQWFYEQGARIATFTWNYENKLGYPNRMKNPFLERPFSIGEEKGLKERGFEYLEQMEALGIIPDVSHLSDGGFWDVARQAKRPFAATHSNARGAAPDAARNLTDDMIKILAEKGGIMGLNFCAAFVRRCWMPGEEGASLEELARQVKYILNIGGEDCLGLGSDFDGIEEAPEMKNGAGMQRLAEALEGYGCTNRQVEKIFYGNVRRFLKENL